MNPADRGSRERPIRVAVVDDHPLVAAALRASTAHGTRVLLVGEARTLDDARRLVASTGVDAPDVVLCDIQLAGAAEGLTLLRELAGTGPRTIVLSSFDAGSLIRAAFDAGAAGYLSKTIEVEDLLRAIEEVADGGTAYSAASLRSIRGAQRPPSDREREVLGGLGRGATNDEIGARLGLSGRTVESHLRRMFDRYGVLSRTELALLAVGEGWIAEPAVIDGRPPG